MGSRVGGFVYRIQVQFFSADVFGDAGEEVWILEAFAVAFCHFRSPLSVKAFLVERPVK